MARELGVSLKELTELHPAWREMGGVVVRAKASAARQRAAAGGGDGDEDD